MSKWTKEAREIEECRKELKNKRERKRYPLRSFNNSSHHFTLGYYIYDGKFNYICYQLMEDGKYQKVILDDDVTFTIQENPEVEFVMNGEEDIIETNLRLPEDYVLEYVGEDSKKEQGIFFIKRWF